MNAQAGPSTVTMDKDAPKKRTRPNTALACARCRSRKVKCDGAQPVCMRCAKDPEHPECRWNEERARQSFKAQNQALRDRILVLESALQTSHAVPLPPPPLEHAMSPNPQEEDHDEAVPITTIGTGSFTLGPDGSLYHSGHNSSFFRTMLVHLEEKADPALANFTSFLLPPYLPVVLSPSLHDQILELAFSRLVRFGLPIDEASFLRDLHLDATRRTANFSRFLHLVLLASGCRYFVDAPSFLCRDGDQASRGLTFIDAAKTLIDQEGTSPQLSSIAGFLLLSTFMVGMATDRLAWMYQGIAVMAALDFQLDQDARVHLPSLSPQELLLDVTRHRTYWDLSLVTSFWSTFTGKASTFPNEVHHQPLPVVDIMDPNPAAQTSFVWNARLSKIAIRIVTIVYTSGGEKRRPPCSVNRLECVEKLDKELEAWNASLPMILHLDGFTGNEPSPDVLTLNMFYCVHTIVLHRPFIDGGRNQHSMGRCRFASSQIVAILHYASHTSYGQMGLPLHAQHAAFCAGTILLLFAAGLDTSGTIEDQAARSRTTKDDLDVVISFLNQFGFVWPAARESSQVLTRLCVDYLVV
ncbi:hypothetical protein BDY24DRAFT_435500 [Mrakia frigida]|uniref:uncharacterized protein n=1 Tax=Mrakia frigida TaxID=29902 RepID=UPI003FCC1A52